MNYIEPMTVVDREKYLLHDHGSLMFSQNALLGQLGKQVTAFTIPALR